MEKYFVVFFEPFYGECCSVHDNLEDANVQKQKLMNDEHCPIPEECINIYHGKEISK